MTATQTLTQRKSAASPSPAPAKRQIVSQGGVVVDRVPASKPNFTVGDIRRAIPAHCFTRPLTKSFGYLFCDIAVAAILYYATSFIPLASDAVLGGTFGPLARAALWVLYWVCQGCVCTGLWVIGHECGHRGFADSELINDAVGLVVHSFLLVPYFSWQLSHKRHHSNTGSVEHDEVFVPVLATDEQKAVQARKESGHHDGEGFITNTVSTLVRMFYIVVMLTLGWPAYLLVNITGNQSYDPKRWVNHFAPESPIFTTGSESDAGNQKLIMLSDVTLLAVFALLYKWASLTSFAHVVFVYFVPYLIVNFWLVLITYLQHTDLNLPHYTDGEWDWLRGALATVDRDYGFINIVLHHITDTHVVHHLFSTMPHYHAEEATAAVKQLLGPYYRYDSTPIATALWNSFRDCTALFPDPQQKGVHWFEPK
jgi:omega-6 fatty acid desaturase (delta-12 desaturase)